MTSSPALAQEKAQERTAPAQRPTSNQGPKQVEFSTRQFLAPNVAKGLFYRLNMKSIPVSVFTKREDVKRFLHTTECENTGLGHDELFVSCPDYLYRIVIVGRDDFNHDGMIDLKAEYTEKVNDTAAEITQCMYIWGNELGKEFQAQLLAPFDPKTPNRPCSK